MVKKATSHGAERLPAARPRRARVAGALVAAGAAALLAPAFAHHGVTLYDMRTVQTISGAVASWDWKNPHTWLSLTVTAEDGSEQRWEIEGAPPRWMEGQGWSPESLTTGEAVEVMIHPKRNEPQAGILMEVARANGEVLKVNRPARLGGP